MGSSAVSLLTVAAYGIHISDQIGLVATPLIAALVFEASPATLGTLVALQALPHLVGSVPTGVLLDRFRPERIALASAALSTIGFALVAGSVSLKSIGGFAASILLSGLGVVVFVLAALSLIPRLVTMSGFAVSNARIELPRAIAGVVAPLLVGLLINAGFWALTFLMASSASAVALWSLVRLARSDVQADIRSASRVPLVQALRMVVSHRLLRPIASTAVLWNLAFAIVIVAAVPYLTVHLAQKPETFGVAMSFFGLGAIAGVWVMRVAAGRIQPRLVLLFGPASSMVAAAILSTLPRGTSATAIMFSFLLLGFGPSMWLVAQNTIRQAVTPNHVLGSVNAVIQTGIYGSRPVGAAVGGLLLGAIDPQAAILVVVSLFFCSFAVATLSGLRKVRSYESVGLEGA
jgi:predicted MFS family arabinose efflux permease